MRKADNNLLIKHLSGFLLVLFLISGCSYQSVRHLQRQRWSLNTTKTLEMKYLKFKYNCKQLDSHLRVAGTAFPKKEVIPEWASWTKEIWLGVYISDQNAKVIAKEIHVLAPNKFKPNQGFNFQMALEPHNMGSPGPLFITFGYRLVLTDHKVKDSTHQKGCKAFSEKEKVFFASESALTKF